MNAAVASKRGLLNLEGHMLQEHELRGQVRRTKIDPRDRAVGQISISHDGAYASAVCFAMDDGGQGGHTPEPVLDDGNGMPVHEPTWGDHGCFVT